MFCSKAYRHLILGGHVVQRFAGTDLVRRLQEVVGGVDHLAGQRVEQVDQPLPFLGRQVRRCHRQRQGQQGFPPLLLAQLSHGRIPGIVEGPHRAELLVVAVAGTQRPRAPRLLAVGRGGACADGRDRLVDDGLPGRCSGRPADSRAYRRAGVRPAKWRAGRSVATGLPGSSGAELGAAGLSNGPGTTPPAAAPAVGPPAETDLSGRAGEPGSWKASAVRCRPATASPDRSRAGWPAARSRPRPWASSARACSASRRRRTALPARESRQLRS